MEILLNSMTDATPSMRYILLRWCFLYRQVVVVPKLTKSWSEIGVSKTIFNRSLTYLVNEGYIDHLKPSHLYNSSSASAYSLSDTSMNLQWIKPQSVSNLELFNYWLAKPLQLDESVNTRMLILASILLKQSYIDVTMHLSSLEALTGMNSQDIKTNASKVVKISGISSLERDKSCVFFGKPPLIFFINQNAPHVKVIHLGMPLNFKYECLTTRMYDAVNLYKTIKEGRELSRKRLYQEMDFTLYSTSALFSEVINNSRLTTYLMSFFNFTVTILTGYDCNDEQRSLESIIKFLKTYLPIKWKKRKPKHSKDMEVATFEAFNEWLKNDSNLAVVDDFYEIFAINIFSTVTEIIYQVKIFANKYNLTVLDICHAPGLMLVASSTLRKIDQAPDVHEENGGGSYVSKVIYVITYNAVQPLPPLAIMNSIDLIDDNSIVEVDKKEYQFKLELLNF